MAHRLLAGKRLSAAAVRFSFSLRQLFAQAMAGIPENDKREVS
jgi:hypothetical protein